MAIDSGLDAGRPEGVSESGVVTTQAEPKTIKAVGCDISITPTRDVGKAAEQQHARQRQPPVVDMWRETAGAFRRSIRKS